MGVARLLLSRGQSGSKSAGDIAICDLRSYPLEFWGLGVTRLLLACGRSGSESVGASQYGVKSVAFEILGSGVSRLVLAVIQPRKTIFILVTPFSFRGPPIVRPWSYHGLPRESRVPPVVRPWPPVILP